jgi:hypothetical protein
MRRLVLALVGGLLITATGCGSGSSPHVSPSARPTPNLARFLALPVATPSACPATQNATTIGRTSPWLGTVDLSIYLTRSATRQDRTAVARELHRQPVVTATYFESRSTAYREFQRLYTCWAAVRRSATPASFRVVLAQGVPERQRNQLIADLLRRPGVDTVSCAPTLQCSGVVTTPRVSPPS